MQNDKSPGNDGSKKYFYDTFWNELKEIFIDSVSETKEKKHLSTSQRQAIIWLIEKKDKDKRFIQIWIPISLLNADLKIISKALSEKLKNVLPDLISTQQAAFDITEIARLKMLEDFLVKKAIEKAFDSLDHNFLISALEKYIFWVKNF